jgi:hypothetical protein
MQRIFRILVVMVVVIVGVIWYFHWSRTRAMNSGAVHVREQPTEAAKAPPETPSVNQPTQPQDQSGISVQPQGENRAETPEVYTLPASETLSRNPPDRTILAGTGRFELYRQGDITWRMDTATGQACVLFATEAMWRRMLVYEHGCGTN